MTTEKQKTQTHIRVKASTKERMDAWARKAGQSIRESADLLILAGIEAMSRGEQTEQQ